ncbi:odorant receptor 46a-like [Copidosoma floridanum]|uniref:odorant receptor 46a-like n=1 Tax=Copidosoma floridanum TaxID=29053 RepID=UPI0006C94A2A|nr:odorant receptor 46a-like [Copidosoma floridanum]
MESLKISFAILSICGIWKPVGINSSSSKWAYDVWRLLFMPQPYLFACAQLARIVLVDLSFQEITEILFIFISILNICCKSVNYVVRRKDIINLTSMLSTDCLLPRDKEEIEIYRRCRQFIRYVTLSSVVLVEITALMFLCLPLFRSKRASRELPFPIYVPWSENKFWSTYAGEFLAIMTVSSISASSNTLIFGLLLEARNQFDLLAYRFGAMSRHGIMLDCDGVGGFEERTLLVQNIRHHGDIFKFIDAIKNTFSIAISGQFVTSSLVISMSVYQLTMNNSFNLGFLTNLLYLMCMLVEFFLYCWFSNELTLKSESFGKSIFKTNWVALDVKNKDIIVVMLRSSKPVVITSGFFIVLSLETFMKVLKLSYSAFSVLRRGK